MKDVRTFWRALYAAQHKVLHFGLDKSKGFAYANSAHESVR